MVERTDLYMTIFSLIYAARLYRPQEATHLFGQILKFGKILHLMSKDTWRQSRHERPQAGRCLLWVLQPPHLYCIQCNI